VNNLFIFSSVADTLRDFRNPMQVEIGTSIHRHILKFRRLRHRQPTTRHGSWGDTIYGVSFYIMGLAEAKLMRLSSSQHAFLTFASLAMIIVWTICQHDTGKENVLGKSLSGGSFCFHICMST
jgi:hypothetical protein